MTLEATMRLEIDHLQSQLAKARGEVVRFRQQAQRETAGLGEKMFGGLKDMLPALSLAAGARGVKMLLTEMDDLADAALRLGESTETIQRVGYASELLASVDVNGVVTSFLKLEKALGDVENAAGRQALERYGVTAAQLAGLPLDEKILVLAEAFKRARAEGTGYNDLLALLGRSAGDLIPLLEQSDATIRETFGGAVVVADEFVQKMAALNDQWDGFAKNAKSATGAALGGLVTLGQGHFDFWKRIVNGDDIRTAFEDAFSTPPPAVNVDLEREKKSQGVAAETARKDAEKAIKAQEDEMKRVSEAHDALTRKRTDAYLDTLPPVERLSELMREIESLESQGAGDALERLKIESEIVDRKRQVSRLEKEIADEIERAAEKERERQAQIQDSRRQTREAGLDTDAERLNEAHRQLGEINSQIAQQVQAGQDTLDLELRREDVQRRILQLQKSMTDEAKRQQQEQQRAQQALSDYQSELDLLRAQASGHERKAEALREQMEVEREMRRIKEQGNVSDLEALAMAEEMVRLRQEIAGMQSGGGGGERKRIQGYSRIKQGEGAAALNLPPDLQQLLNAAGDQRGGPQQAPGVPGFGGGPFTAPNFKNPLELIAKENKRREDSGARNPMGGTEDLLGKMLPILREGLAVGS